MHVILNASKDDSDRLTTLRLKSQCIRRESGQSYLKKIVCASMLTSINLVLVFVDVELN